MFKVKGFHYELVAILGRFGKHIQTYPSISTHICRTCCLWQYTSICSSLFLLCSVCEVGNPDVIYRVNLIESRMASVRSGNKETLSCDNKRGKGLEDDFKHLKLKEEMCLAKEGGKMEQETEEKAEVKKEQGKTTGKEVVAANKEKTVVEVGPEEFLKHPLQVAFVITCTRIMFFIQTLRFSRIHFSGRIYTV